jgi:hypothetical protein
MTIFSKSGFSGTSQPDVKINVEHLFFHPLIVNTDAAFRPGKRMSYMCDWFVTVNEFREFISQAYQRGYVLVSLHDLIDNRGTALSPGKLKLPEGKKPLILSVDDLNYYPTMRSRGTAKRLEIRNNRLYSVVDSPSGERFLDDEEIVTIIDNFVASHPDFSWKGAKGIIALTGYMGVFGYDTVPSKKNASIEVERAKAAAVARYLKKNGWEFASHGYQHLAESKYSVTTIERDVKRWNDEVAPIVGSTQIHIYPFGDILREGDANLDVLKQAGFRYYFGTTFVSSLHLQGEIVYGNRIPIDGKYIMGRVSGSRHSQFCDIQTVIDPNRILVFGKEYPRIAQTRKSVPKGGKPDRKKGGSSI